MNLHRLAAPALAAIVFVACNSANVMDNDRLQSLIESWLEDNAQVTANVTCPQNEPIRQGDVFTCTAVTQDGLTLVVQVTQTDNSGNVDLALTGAS